MRGSAAEAKTAVQPQLQTAAALQTQLHARLSQRAEQHGQAEARSAATETKAQQSTELVRLRNQVAAMKADASRRTAAAAEQAQAEQEQEEARSWETLLPNSPPLPRAGGVICYFLEIRDVPRFPGNPGFPGRISTKSLIEIQYFPGNA